MAIDAEAAQQDRAGRLAEQRRSLPDQPGVYLFRDARGRVIYVGKAKSIRKRVASHFSNPTLYGTHAITDEVDTIEPLVVATEAEALLTEQTFIKRYKPRFNIRLRDDKSYPYIAISIDEEFPRVYFTRERHKRERAYFGPYSSAKRVRGTLDLLGKIFQLRSCEGAEPGRHSGSPCLDYYIKRCGAPCVGYVTREEYMQGVDGTIAFLSGRFKQIERDLEQRMHWHAGEQDYEAAALARNRLQAVRALLERQRVANEGAGTYDAVAVAVEATEANAQVFQVRDGVLSDRQSFYLENQGEQPPAVVAEEFILQYYATALSIPSLLVVQFDLQEGSEIEILEQILAERRGGPVEIRPAERGAKRRILDLAERNARLALDQEKLKTERRRQQRVEALDGLQRALALETLPVRIECFDISHLGGTHTTASMVVFEGGAPKKADYRRFTIREVDPGDDYGAMAEVLSRRYAQWVKQSERSPYDADRDASFGALPNLIVIDGGKGQLAAGLEPLQGFRELGVAVAALAKRVEEIFLPGRQDPVVLAARDARAAVAPAHPRRGAPVRDHPPPDPARQGDDRVDHGRPAGHRARAQARPAQALRLARRGARRLARGARARPGPAAEGRARPLHPPQPDRTMSRRTTRDTSSVSTNGRGPSHLVDFVIISGLSGAGKSSAMNVFEDAGYFCVDNLPAEMIRSLAELFRHPGSKVERAAVVSDSRAGEYLSALAGVIDELDEAGIVHRVLFLESDEQTLLNRYKETRRRHPLVPHGSVVDGVRRERELLGAGARAGGLVHRHQRAQPGGAAAQGGRRAARAGHARPARGHVHLVRPQARPAARRRPRARRALPPEPALRGRPAAADGVRPADRRLRRPRRPPAGVLRPRAAAARVPAAAVRRRGQGAPRGRDRLHRRPPPLGRDRRAPRERVPRSRRVLRRGPAPGRGPGARPRRVAGAGERQLRWVGKWVSGCGRRGRVIRRVYYERSRGANKRRAPPSIPLP